MNRLFAIFVFAVQALFAAQTCSAATLFTSGGPATNAGAVASNFAGHDPEYEIHSADDFLLPTPAALTRIRWWGAYQSSNVPLDPDHFTVRIFSDAGGVPAIVPLLDFTATKVHRSVTKLRSDGLDVYEYTVALHPHLTLPAGRYWLCILNDVEVEEVATDWLWILSDNASGNYAYRFNDGTSWQSGYPFTLAFEIEGVPQKR